MLRAEARFSTRFSGCSARERDFHQFFRMLCVGARFLMKKLRNFEGALHGSFHQKFQDPRGNAIFVKIFRTLCAGARFSSKNSGCSARGGRFSSKFSRCSARERNFLQILRMLRTGARFFQNKTTLSGAFWYRVGIGSIP